MISRDFRRRFLDRFMMVILGLGSALAIVPLISVFSYVLSKGLSGLNLDFFTKLPAPVGEMGGGMAHAMFGSLILLGIACVIGIPWGLAAGIFLSEYKATKLAPILRFTTDLLTSVPSIIVGLFVYGLIVLPFKGFSAFAGGVALAVIMIPTVARTTEEMLKLIPDHIREAGLALGIPRWKMIIRIVLRGSISGVATGVMLSVARVIGETAPLLLTAFGNQYWSNRIDQPIASLPVQIYTYAISPYDDWHRQAWSAALVLVGFVFILNLTTRLILAKRSAFRD
jgi:phosphate transport system permease protein